MVAEICVNFTFCSFTPRQRTCNGSCMPRSPLTKSPTSGVALYKNVAAAYQPPGMSPWVLFSRRVLEHASFPRRNVFRAPKHSWLCSCEFLTKPVLLERG